MESNNTFEVIAGKWLEMKRLTVKQSTFCAYKLTVRIHLLPRFATATAISEEEAQQFLLDKLTGGLGRKTTKDILAVLRAIVRYGSRHYGFPAENWEIVFPTDTRRRALPVLSVRNHRKLLRHITATPTPQNIGILLSLCTGMRIGEVCALRWTNVDLKRRVITVSHTLGRIYDTDTRTTRRVLTSPKTKTSNREIPIGKELLDALRQIRPAAAASAFVVGGTANPKEPRIYREYFSRLLRRQSIPKIVFHGLRHTFATRCIECMCDYKTVSVILGHSNVATTMNLYVHPNHDQKKRCIDKLSKFITC